MSGNKSGPFRRADRVADAIQEEVSDLLRLRIKDPRIGFVTITGVEVTADLRHARIFFSVVGDRAARDATQRGLDSATGFIQGALGRRLRLRFTPTIEFRFDPSIERGARIERLLKEIETRPAGEGEDADDAR